METNLLGLIQSSHFCYRNPHVDSYAIASGNKREHKFQFLHDTLIIDL